MKLILIAVAVSIFSLAGAVEDKNTDKYTDKNTDRNEDKNTNRNAEKNTDRNADKNTDRNVDKNTNRNVDKNSDRNADKNTDRNADKYTDKYDGMDIDEVMSNKRLFNAYTKCVLDQGKCTPEAKELKSHITEALQNGCSKCTKTQKQGMKKVIKHYITDEPDSWKQMVQKYDPQGRYSSKYEKEMQNIMH